MTQFVHLHSDEASIVIERDPARGFLWRHCGARVDPGDLPPLADARGAATFSPDVDSGLPIAPANGLGWFGPAALEMHTPSRDMLHFLPAQFSHKQSGNALELSSLDPVAGIRHRLAITLLDGGAFRFDTSLANEGSEPVHLAALASAFLPLAAASSQVVSWRGRHNAELVECREAMPEHRWERISRRGISGHGGPPGVYILAEEAGWHSGLALALQLGWSGDHSIAIERDDEGFWHLAAQAVLAPGEATLQPGETWQAPPAYLAISDRGRNGAMAQQHAAMRSLVGWPGGAMPPRPVHLNSWEACYFDHDADRIDRLAAAAADIGVERFVLDDGWFAGRRDDRSGLGDWWPDPQGYPDGLAPLALKVRKRGMEFGLWVEPEMVNPDSELFRAHPNWALAPARRDAPTARNQLVLDMRREDVRDYLFGKLDALLRDTPISYLKWDHNRDHAPGGGAAQQRGAYALFDRLRSAHPEVEIEGCSGGGGRSDAGLAPFVHRFWTSDNIDAVSRVAMQRGFLAFLPPEMMGAHIGASPSHATGRSQSMAFRAAIACTGHLGVELDPEQLAQSERAQLSHWIAFYKKWRHLLHDTQIHLGEAADGLHWQAHGTPDRKILFCIRSAPPEDRRPQPLRLPFAGSRGKWQATLLGIAGDQTHAPAQPALYASIPTQPQTYTASWLSKAGLPLPAQRAESVAIFMLEKSS